MSDTLGGLHQQSFDGMLTFIGAIAAEIGEEIKAEPEWTTRKLDE